MSDVNQEPLDEQSIRELGEELVALTDRVKRIARERFEVTDLTRPDELLEDIDRRIQELEQANIKNGDAFEELSAGYLERAEAAEARLREVRQEIADYERASRESPPCNERHDDTRKVVKFDNIRALLGGREA